MDGSRFLLASAVCFILCHTGYTQDSPSIRMEYGGKRLSNKASILVPRPDEQSQSDNVYISVTCDFASISTDVVVSIIIRSKANSSSEWNDEMQCLYVEDKIKDPVILPNHEIGDNVERTEEGITCTRTSMSIQLMFQIGMPVSYDCMRFDNIRHTKSPSSAFDLLSHTQPTKPEIRSNRENLIEGQDVTFTCTSEAKPPPALMFKIGDVPMELAQLTPAVGDVEFNTPSAQSSLVLDMSIRSNLRDKTLTCETIDHPYENTISSSQPLLIVYGPSKEGQGRTKEEKLTLNSNTPAVVTCSMDGYPLEYKWMLPNRQMLHKDQNITITDYSDELYNPDGTYPQEVRLTCFAENTISRSSVGREYVIELSKAIENDGRSGESSKNGSEPMESWLIAVIVVVIVVVLIIIIITAVCCVKRKRSRDNPKAVQARRQSEDRSDDNMTKYQSSTASLSRQSDRQANYHENPTLPVDYRYSQGSAPSVDTLDGMIDAKPRSRKPIALDDMDHLDGDAGPPQYGEGPPAYSSAPSPYPKNEGYRSPNYDNSYLYGAAC